MARIMIETLLSYVIVLQSATLNSSMHAVELLQVGRAKSDLPSVVYDVLAEHETPGSLAYVTTCDAAPQQMSDLNLGSFPQHHTLYDSMNQIVHDVPRLTWSRSSVVELRDTCLKQGLLQVRVREVFLKKIVNPDDVVDAILSTPEVKAYLNKYHYIYEEAGSVLQGLRGVGRELPTVHLADVTVEEVLNRSLKMFPGVWVYIESVRNQEERYFELYIREFSTHHVENSRTDGEPVRK